MQKLFEATDQQKKLANIGRAMMDFSEYFDGLGKLTDAQLGTLNKMSHVGGMLTKLGTTFGPRAKDFTAEDQQLIIQFTKKELDLQSL